MELLLVRTHLDKEPQKVDISTCLEQVKDSHIFYFDKENSHKDMMDMIDFFESEDLNVYFREVKYGLAENDYMYEVHVIR